MTARCPTCRAVVATDGNDAFPFCSPRCRLVDLGRWLGEEYRVPAVEDDEGELQSVGPEPPPPLPSPRRGQA
jgi:hypothetical protein